MPLRHAVVLSLAVVSLLPTAPSAAAQADSVLLGGPCVDGAPSRFLELRRARGEAEARGDLAAAIRLQQEIVRLQCGNAWRWIDLAKLHLEAEEPRRAVAVIDHIEPWAANLIAGESSRLEDLGPLWESEAYRGSDLARRMAGRRRAHAERLERFRARFDALSRRPPELHVAEGACPFECCVYRTWSVRRETPLYEGVGGDSVVARVEPGDSVRAVTGEVHVRPAPVAVVHRPADGGPIREGDIIFLLDYVGEGFSRVWQDGEILTVSTVPDVQPYCPIPSDHCWGEHLFPEAAEADDARVWWVRVETSDGSVGWTREVDHFGGKDACG